MSRALANEKRWRPAPPPTRRRSRPRARDVARGVEGRQRQRVLGDDADDSRTGGAEGGTGGWFGGGFETGRRDEGGARRAAPRHVSHAVSCLLLFSRNRRREFDPRGLRPTESRHPRCFVPQVACKRRLRRYRRSRASTPSRSPSRSAVDGSRSSRRNRAAVIARLVVRESSRSRRKRLGARLAVGACDHPRARHARADRLRRRSVGGEGSPCARGVASGLEAREMVGREGDARTLLCVARNHDELKLPG